MENWKPIPGYDGYEVSDLGRVRSHKRGNARVLRMVGRYCGVSLSRGGVVRRALVHSLVAAAFIGPRPAGAHINHKSGDKSDNSAANLEYTTAAENEAHAVAHGLKAHGVRHGLAKLTPEKVREIRAAYRPPLTQRDLAAVFGVSQPTIRSVLIGRTWREVES